METLAISYRVADFLKQHPPFHAMAEADLIALAERGRVRFYEANDFLMCQGEPHKPHIFVIQQGTVSLWDESGAHADLRDMLGAGDMVGLERFDGGRHCAHSARAGSDVVVYTFPAEEFGALVDRYPHAAQYVAACNGVAADYRPAGARQAPHESFLHEVVKRKRLATCPENSTVRDAARRLAAGADAIAVVDHDQHARAILTSRDLLEWIQRGAGDPDEPVTGLLHTPAATIAPDATVADGVLMMADSGHDALALTEAGARDGRLHAVATARDLAPVFGDQPAAILREIEFAESCGDLRALNARARAFTLHHLGSPTSLDWLARFTHAVDTKILAQIVALEPELRSLEACWCFCATAGRGESLTLAAPWPVVILENELSRTAASAACQHVLASLVDCGYLPAAGMPFDQAFYVSSLEQWRARFTKWVREPILEQTYKARLLFDLRAVHGPRHLWHELASAVGDAVDGDFLYVLANDCLGNLPPLTFFQDAVVDDTGEFATVFRLDESVLSPLVDVGRVFGLAAGAGLGCSTIDRFTRARRLFHEHESIFRDAADTLRMVLWQQGRVGIAQGTDGAELPPALLSRQDRHLLKASFRSILRLIQFTADPAWIRAL